MLEGLKERVAKSAKVHQSVGIIVPMNNYQDLVDAIFSEMLNNKNDEWVYLTITKSYDTLNKSYPHLIEHKT